MRKKTNYILFEGLPGGGKTTNINKLLHYPDCAIIPDIGNPNGLDSLFEINWNYLIELEYIKSYLIQHSKAYFTFQERGYLSILAFHYAEKMLGLNEIYSEAYKEIEKKIKNGLIILPDLMILIDIEPKFSQERQPGVKLFIWKNTESLNHMWKFYSDYARNPFFGEKVMSISQMDTLTLEDLLSKISN